MFELDARARYTEGASLSGNEKFTTGRPFPITLVPARLLDGLHP